MTPTQFTGYPDLPGADLVAAGLADLERGVDSIAALLVSIGAPRLTALGVPVARPLPHPERSLYQRLHLDDPDAAHSRYNALVRRLVSFERALAWRASGHRPNSALHAGSVSRRDSPLSRTWQPRITNPGGTLS